MQATTFLDTKLVEPMVEHEICLRAYEIYESRGKIEGHALDWLQAQADVQRRSHGFLRAGNAWTVCKVVAGGGEGIKAMFVRILSPPFLPARRSSSGP